MNTAIDWKTVFVGADGRLARSPFWIAAAVLVAVMAFYEWWAGGVLHLISGFFVYPLAIYFATCVLAKRLHDRGRSGWYAAPILIALSSIWSGANSPVSAIFWIILVWAAVELAALTGETGANRFGPNPLPGA